MPRPHADQDAVVAVMVPDHSAGEVLDLVDRVLRPQVDPTAVDVALNPNKEEAGRGHWYSLPRAADD